MKFIAGFLLFLLAILQAIFRDSWKAIATLFDVFEDLFEAWQRRERLPGRQGKTSPRRCVPVPSDFIKHPDPLIYDQYYLMSLGYAVSWDNPDIQLMYGGIPVSSNDLQADTEYEIVARVWNSSVDAPYAQLPVLFSYLSFGVGTKSNPIGVNKVDLDVKGGPQCPAFARMKWTTPPTPGHYCLQVFLDAFDDSNKANNLGQENTNVGTAHSPADLVFALRNATDVRHVYRFQTDAYTIPAPPPCEPGTQHQRGNGVPAQHDAANYPPPPGWTIAFNPSEPILGPGDQVDVHALITPAAGFTGTQAFNVNAFTEAMDFAGGVTLYVQGT
ncbi:MAG TPA: hypothetical protein VIG51_12490 [Candidatus Baltobacteraceae bacterium]|jgi:hypothetical protein